MGQVLIDERLVFDEDNFLLFCADTPDEAPLRLGAIASRCLAMLLKSQGAVLRKRDLMAGAWGQYGLEVTENSLAQVVRQLRLALDKLHPGREYIQTLPRIGYKLAEGVQVSELPALEAPVPAPVPGHDEGDAGLPTAALAQGPASETFEAAEPAARLAITPPTPARRTITPAHWLLLCALPLWGALAFGLGAAWPEGAAPPVERPHLPAFAAPQRLAGLRVHLPRAEPHAVTASGLELLAQRGQQVAKLLGIDDERARLYLLPSRHGEHLILCDGELETLDTRCFGVQQQ